MFESRIGREIETTNIYIPSAKSKDFYTGSPLVENEIKNVSRNIDLTDFSIKDRYFTKDFKNLTKINDKLTSTIDKVEYSRKFQSVWGEKHKNTIELAIDNPAEEYLKLFNTILPLLEGREV